MLRMKLRNLSGCLLSSLLLLGATRVIAQSELGFAQTDSNSSGLSTQPRSSQPVQRHSQPASKVPQQTASSDGAAGQSVSTKSAPQYSCDPKTSNVTIIGDRVYACFVTITARWCAIEWSDANGSYGLETANFVV